MKLYGFAFLAWAFFWFFLVLMSQPELLAFSDRAQFVSSKPFFYSFYVYSAIASSLFFHAASSYKLLLLSSFFVLFDLYLGSREFFALFLFSHAFLKFSSLGRVRLIAKHSYAILGALLVLFALTFKYSYHTLHSGDVAGFFSLLANQEFVFQSLYFSEPSIIQGNLYLVVEKGFELSLSHLLPVLLFLTPVHRSWVGFDLEPMSRKMEEYFYGSLDFGIAGNFIGEFYAIFDVFFFLPLLLYMLSALSIVNYLVSARRPLVRVFGIMLSFYAVFYIHRIEFYEVFGIFRILVFVFLPPLVMYILIKFFLRAELRDGE
ncbi:MULTISPECIES: hypothetical protein [Halomonas]|uniref:hypothetical protein n=1 Tax=Halomonas TaxID=2745 RepID=UPI0011BF64DF|nr:MULTISPECIES: hypothetical protein [Halomonas]MDR5890200.1 hypothetical protein [Halomonas salina]WJY05881.1 hypothetical protein QWG60_09140 [Halomonas halophila]